MLNYINGCKMKGESFDPADLAASFQKAVVEVLVGNSMKAAEELGISNLQSQVGWLQIQLYVRQ